MGINESQDLLVLYDDFLRYVVSISPCDPLNDENRNFSVFKLNKLSRKEVPTQLLSA